MRISKRGPGSGAPPPRTDARRPARPVPVGRAHRPQDWFAHRLLLVLSGQRPVRLLLGHAGATAYDQLCRLAPRAPLRPPPGGAAPVLRGVGACRPSADAIEAFARVTTGDRTRALAFRLERRPDGRWQCAAIELDTVP
ncbi:Rv3235 family protein [Streptomyces sp. NBC_01803]|uniref:Rv3235 family protein n=1 Tax=Streptomyces sp. NBC_01803 TaxID=2975946 RepID=UPI002DD99222|nr:Rv3235 family protein [Streptomyces sp. NBC_01803]WSA44446.1 Rv3235 family protein [Streptomyces sp. NBC_01803]